MASMNLGITGSKGFVGSHLIKHLSNLNIPYVSFSGDLLNSRDVRTFYATNNITDIIHLVGTFDLPLTNLIEKNVLITQNILEIGREFGIKKIIYASTGAVYGEPLEKLSKEVDPLKPNTFYGLSKLFAEQIIQYYADNYNLKYIVLRFPNIYGEGNTKGVIFNFLRDIQNKKQIVIAGDGEQRRNFLYVADACEAISRAIDYQQTDIFNIASDTNYSLNEVVSILSEKYQFSTLFKPEDNQLRNLILDTTKAKSLLNFSAKKDLRSFLI